ncbi:MAG: protein kinase [Acidobacteriota bacterium]
MVRNDDLESEATPRRGSGALPPSIGPYRVDGRLGRGGMGEVYRGHDDRLDRPVALKCLRVEPNRDTAAMRQRFHREARALARVRHPAIVEVYDWIETDDGDWLVMELLEGRSLRQVLREDVVPRRRALEIARDLAAGLVAVDGEGIVHRDLKPDNVMVLPPGGRVKLLDFGLAKRVESLDGVTLTETVSEKGQILGTVRYMSPEQASGYRLDARSDLFSLGVVLYEMLSGVSPFRGATAVETLTRICTVREAPLTDHVPDLPPAVAELVQRMLEKEPERRVESALDVEASLTRILSSVEPGDSETERFAVLPRKGPLEDPGAASAETLADNGSTDGFAWTDRSRAVPDPVTSPTAPALAPTTGPVRRSARWRGAILGIALLAISGLAWSWWAGQAAPLDVAVLAPVAGSVDDSVRPALVASAIQGALERRLTLLQGISLTPSQESHGLAGTASEAARSLAVDEVVSSRFDCAERLCQIQLRRIAASGELLWSLTIPSRADDLLELHNAVDQTFRRGYAERRGLPGSDKLAVAIDDYGAYLEIAASARDQLAAGSSEESVERLREIQRSSPTFMDAYLLEGRLMARRFLDTRDPAFHDRAITAYGQAHDLAPRNPLPLIALADFARQSGANERMASAIKALRGLIGGHPRVLALESLMAERAGQVETALAAMRNAESLLPSVEMKRYLGMMEYRRGHLRRAAERFEEILALKPGDLDVQLTLANIELLAGSPTRAAELFGDLAEGSEDLGVWMNLGVAHMLLGRWADAEDALEHAVGLAPNFPGLLLNLAQTRLVLGHHGAAEAGYRSVLQILESSDSEPTWQDWTVRGQALAHLGEASAAVAAAQEALRLAGDNPQVAVEVATVFALAGETTSAIVSAERARAAGIDARWFTFPWFDALRSDPRFVALLDGAEPQPPGEVSGGL